MADAGVARDPGRLPWLEPYRAPPRRKSNRRAGVSALLGIGGLVAVAIILTGELIPGPVDQPVTPQASVVLPAPEELQPQIILPPLQSRETPASAGRPEPARLVRPARRLRRGIGAVPANVAYQEVVRHQAGEQEVAPAQVSEAASAIAALPLPPDPPRPAVNPSAQIVRGKTVQLGVYLTAAQAETAWQRAIRDYTFLVTMPKSIQPVSIRSRRFYRLQLGTPSKKHAKQLCSNLKSIGRACTVA
jgi:hypothetical protein